MTTTKFSLKDYVVEFHQETFEANYYEKPNLTYLTLLINFSRDGFTYIENNQVYKSYIQFEDKFSPESYDNFCSILRNSEYGFYYKYYSTITPITYAVQYSISFLASKGSIKLRGEKYVFTPSTIKYLEILTNCIIYENLDIDNLGRNRFYKKKTALVLKKIIVSELNEKVCFNQILDCKDISEIKFVEKRINVFCIKVLWLVEDILRNLCFGMPYITYAYISGGIGGKKKGNEAYKKNSSNEEETFDLNTLANLSDVENNSNPLVNFELGEEESKFKKTDERYKSTGVRYLVFSQKLKLYRDLSRHIFKNPPVLVGNQITFSSSRKYNIFSYNTANDETTSKSSYDLTLLKVLLNTPIHFSKDLYFSIISYFDLRYQDRLTIFNNTKIRAIREILTELFKSEQEYVKLYFPFVMDFRGRVYIDNPISITDIKLLRYLISPQDVKQFKSLTRNIYYTKFQQLIPILQTLETNIKSFKETKKILILLGLLSLGKVLKSKLIEEDSSVSIETFIKKGIFIFNIKHDQECIDSLKLTDIDDIAEVITLRLKIRNFIEKDENFCVLLDSTASGIFHLNLWLNAKSEYQKYLNLSEEWKWFDTYTFLFSITKLLMGESFPQHLEHLFTRARLKKLYMTIPYNATKFTLICYFREGMTTAEWGQIKPFVEPFIVAINETFKVLFKTPLKSLQHLPHFNNSYKFRLNKNYYDMTYYVTENKEREIVVGGKRWHFTEIRIVSFEQLLAQYNARKAAFDEKEAAKKKKRASYIVKEFEEVAPVDNINHTKAITAFIANTMHCTDANFLNKIVLKAEKRNIHVQTVHDEFIVPVDAVFDIIEIANESYSELYFEINGLRKEYNSFFILL